MHKLLIALVCGAFGVTALAQPSQLLQAPNTNKVELWRGLVAGMSAEEAGAIIQRLPGITGVKVRSHRGRQTLHVSISRNGYGFVVAEHPVLIDTTFGSTGLETVRLTVRDNSKPHMCPSEVRQTFGLFSQLLGARYQPASAIGDGGYFTDGGLAVRLTTALQKGFGKMDLNSAFCRQEGGQYGNVVITYLPARLVDAETQRAEDRVRRAIDGL